MWSNEYVLPRIGDLSSGSALKYLIIGYNTYSLTSVEYVGYIDTDLCKTMQNNEIRDLYVN